ncbi:ISL3 family transposase [Ruegeria sp.]|uniref:ISL3 family transposase n=1 Tax=Ruegeria sp. TaxID=1879320 RepID=UPI003AFF7EC6
MDILQLNDFDLIRFAEEDHEFHIYAKLSYETSHCKHCGKYGVVGFGRREQVIKDLPRLGKRSSVYVETRRWRCKHCGKTFYEELPHVDEKRRMTNRLVQWIGEQAVRRTNSSVAEDVGVAEGTVRLVFAEYVQRKYAATGFATPRWLGIDGIHLIKPRCVLINVEKLTAFDILKGRDETTVAERLACLDHRQNIELLTIDMWRPYRDAAAAVLPNAAVVVDKFHMIRMLNVACETVSKALRADLTPAERRRLVNDHLLILKREHHLSDKEQITLCRWLENQPVLALAHKIKEAGYRIYDAKRRDDAKLAFEEWCAAVPQEMKSAFGDFEQAWRAWSEEILAYFDCHANNAYTESLKVFHGSSGGVSAFCSENELSKQQGLKGSRRRRNYLISTTKRGGRGHSFEALRAKVLFSGRSEHKGTGRQAFPQMLRRDINMAKTAHEMCVSGHYEARFGTPLSTFLEILNDSGFDGDQS